MAQKPVSTDTVIYHPPRERFLKLPKHSIQPVGLDTEADTKGRCFMVCTSLGDVWTIDKWPACMFDRTHRDRAYVTYNLKYDMGALLQHLPRDILDILRRSNRVKYNDIGYRVIANKYLSISSGHHYVQVYDIMSFYGGSLDYNAHKYLHEAKLDQPTKRYTRKYISANWQSIADYCVHDATLTARLADRIIGQFGAWGLPVKKLYSTANVSYQWFAAKCGHPSVGYLWYNQRRVLDYAMSSYNGGKFEVTRKGASYLYEYDIASAYPHSIANLVDLSTVRVVWDTKYRREAVYGFIDTTVDIPYSLPSPVAVKRSMLNTYPVGRVRKTITKCEYDYFVANNCDVKIHSACWLHVDRKTYPYRTEINRLYALKSELKHGDPLAYHTVKILMNSLYGKFVQLIPTPDGHWSAGSSWNPIYASVITAETRVRISDLQRRYPQVWAVHTDSVISDAKLPYDVTTDLGALSYECEGTGLVAGCGVYQIGNKTALRGVPTEIPLVELVRNAGETMELRRDAPYTWRQILANGWDTERINRFESVLKELRPDSDRKRLWIDDAHNWHDLLSTNYVSEPLIYDSIFYGAVG